jgi:hypothetical protein
MDDQFHNGSYLLAFHLLKPGGYVVLTIDRFLNLRPFSSREVKSAGHDIRESAGVC